MGNVGIGDNADWTFTGSLTEAIAGVNNNAKMDDIVTVQHLTNPPVHAGEAAPNPKKPALALNPVFEAGKAGIVFNTNPNKVTLPDAVAHNDHIDVLGEQYTVLVNANNKDIDAYQILYLTSHDIDAEHAFEGSSKLTSATLPASTFGSALCLIETISGRFRLALSVSNASVAALTAGGARIRQGSPASPGPVILTLNNSDFQDIAGLGMASVPNEVIFPSANRTDLVNGNTFVELVLSTGTLAGSIGTQAITTNVPTLSAWGTIVLMLAFLIPGVWVLVRRRARISSFQA